MIIYNEQRLVPTDVNMMVIRNRNNEGYLYVHRSLLEQAVVIADLFEEDLEGLTIAVTGSSTIREDVQYFYDNAPAPINYLAPYLSYVKEPLDTYEDMCGALHVMSGQINFRKVLKIDVAIRTNPTFSLSIREEYQLGWDRFLQNAMPYESDMYFRSVVPNGTSELPMNGTANDNSEYADVDESLIGEDGQVYDDPLMAVLLGCGDDFFDIPADEEASEEETESADDIAANLATPVEPEPTPIVEPEPEPEPAKLTGIDSLIGGI